MKVYPNKIIAALLSVVLLSCFSTSVLAKRQVAMEQTLRALDQAERILKNAKPNKGGHRVKALRLIRMAKKEIQKGIEFANRRGAGGQYKQKIIRKEPGNEKQFRKEKNSDDRDYEVKERIIERRY